MDESNPELVTVLGPTAVGKTVFSAHLALHLGGEIISADSRQVYREMNIGTGKDYKDYLVDGNRVPVHLIDIVDAGTEYNVYLFNVDFLRIFTDITNRGLKPIMCGGTGLYIESILRDYRLLHVPVDKHLREDLEGKSYEELEGILRMYGPLHNNTDTVNRKRLVRAIEIAMYQASIPEQMPDSRPLKSVVLGLTMERAPRRIRITERLMKRLDEGLVREVEELLQRGVSPAKMEYYGLEYRHVTRYLMNEVTYDEMFRSLNTAIHQFAKRQMTYFRGMERRGITIHWIDAAMNLEDMISQALELVT
jgi:tRNA dimethylallyltransferase